MFIGFPLMFSLKPQEVEEVEEFQDTQEAPKNSEALNRNLNVDNISDYPMMYYGASFLRAPPRKERSTNA